MSHSKTVHTRRARNRARKLRAGALKREKKLRNAKASAPKPV